MAYFQNTLTTSSDIPTVTCECRA